MSDNGHAAAQADAFLDADWTPAASLPSQPPLAELSNADGLAICVLVGLAFVLGWLMLVGYGRRR